LFEKLWDLLLSLRPTMRKEDSFAVSFKGLTPITVDEIEWKPSEVSERVRGHGLTLIDSAIWMGFVN
jgi:hypothetical protein